MRVMVKFSFPTETGNDDIQDGKVAKVFGQIMTDLKPEAAYFYPVDGERGGHLIINIADSSEIVGVGERLFLGLNAAVELVPVMSGEDLQKGLADIDAIAKAYA